MQVTPNVKSSIQLTTMPLSIPGLVLVSMGTRYTLWTSLPKYFVKPYQTSTKSQRTYPSYLHSLIVKIRNGVSAGAVRYCEKVPYKIEYLYVPQFIYVQR